MTYAAVPALRVDDSLAKEWIPALAATTYDPGIRPVVDKAGALAGMGMTEKQGGSDVRANLTEARPTGVDGEYTLHGHKWFTSAPMNDVFLVLAQAEGGLTCFVVPRALPDGSRNPLDVVRLKDKLGNRSNASAEIELDGTLARRLGDEGRGVRTIIEMVAATRLDCVLGSASLMRHALAEASWHVAHRSAFGSKLADKPLMQNVVADLAVESEAATALAIRLAAAVDGIGDRPRGRVAAHRLAPGEVLGVQAHARLRGRGAGVPGRQRLRRGLRAPAALPRGAAQLGVGGVGQRQRARRPARAARESPRCSSAWITEVGRAHGADARLDRAVDDTLALLGDEGSLEVGARRLAGRMAACLQGSLLVRFAPPEVADAFCGSRLGSSYDGTYGTLSTSAADLRTIVARTTPTL